MVSEERNSYGPTEIAMDRAPSRKAPANFHPHPEMKLRSVLKDMGASVMNKTSGNGTFFQRASPPSPPWRLLPDLAFPHGLNDGR